MTFPDSDFYRADPITGCYNFLSFVEALNRLSNVRERKPFSILYLDVNFMGELNEIKGFAYGDSILRWLGIVLRESCGSDAYRISEDDFAVILSDGDSTRREELLKHTFVRLNKEGEQMGIPTPPAAMALIHFEAGYDISINDIFFHLGETVRTVKMEKDRSISIFQARDLLKSKVKTNELDPASLYRSWEVLNFIANRFIDQVLYLGQELDAAQMTSYQDAISGLPNLRAALRKLDQAIHASIVSHQLFSVLLIDGDDFHRYNNVNYATGDDVIHKTGQILSDVLRPEDFVARWRTGDEFIIILPNTSAQSARIAAERFRLAVKETSKTWVSPSSISIGIATYPANGEDAAALMDAAEGAIKRAKTEGKDRVVLAS
jgi:diguanylate cyclase (GGDEF)-like protein